MCLQTHLFGYLQLSTIILPYELNAARSGLMKLAPCKSNEGSASWAVSYLLRKDETGLVFATEIMNDQSFKQGIANLLKEQKKDFYNSNIRMSPELRDRRGELLKANAAPFHCVGTRQVKALGKLIRDMDTTMQFQEKGHHFRLFIEPIKLPDAADPDGVAKVMKAVEAVRDLFPENLPALFTLHTGGNKLSDETFTIEEAIQQRKNIHIQGLIATKPWLGIDYTARSPWNSGWDKPFEMVAPKKGNERRIGELAALVEKSTTAAIGTSFTKHTRVIQQQESQVRVAIDPDRPLRTLFTSAAATFMRRYSNEQLHNLPLESIRNPRVREEVRQVLAIDTYDKQHAMTSGMTREIRGNHRKVVLSAPAEKFVKRHTVEQLQRLDLDTIRSPKIRAEVRSYLQSVSIASEHSTRDHSTQIFRENSAMMSELDDSLRFRLGTVAIDNGARSHSSQNYGYPYHSTQHHLIPRELRIYAEIYSFSSNAFTTPDWYAASAGKAGRLSASLERNRQYHLNHNVERFESLTDFLERRARERELASLLEQEQLKQFQEQLRRGERARYSTQQHR